MTVETRNGPSPASCLLQAASQSMSRNDSSVAVPQVGGKVAILLFIVTLFGFVAETQLTQYAQTTLGFRHPYFIFYVVHSSFAIIFPLHLLYLVVFKKYTARALLAGLRTAITLHMSPPNPDGSRSTLPIMFPLGGVLRLALMLTIGYSLPGLLWFSSITLSSVSDITAIWNTNAFFAYVFAVKIFQLKWEPRRLMAVLLATSGVLVVVYGGSRSQTTGKSHPSSSYSKTDSPLLSGATGPLIGDMLTLVASIIYGLYQVLYAKYVALPSDPVPLSSGDYEPVASSDGGPLEDDIQAKEAVSPLPFGFHANLLTSAIGLLTFLILWIPLPFLHYFGSELFAFPKDTVTFFTIAGIASSGIMFNAGFMILLGIWGPVITSVGNLLTIVLVLISDVLFGAAIETITVWSLVGAGVIVAAFGVLAYDMFNAR